MRCWILSLLVFGLTQNALPQLSSTPDQPPAPPPKNEATAERPDFSVKIPRLNAPLRGDYDITSDFQESEGGVYHLHGHVVVELYNATFKADEAEYDENTKTFKAHGNVYYRNYDQNEVIYCDRAEYNTDTSTGTYYHVRGYTKTKVVARPGMLTTQEPFYFEGAYAEKLEDKYLLHDGIITDCHIPHPWWILNSKLFDIVPEDRAIAHNAVFHIRGIPIFFFPYFYKALKKEPRKSGFLTPEAGHSSQFGYFVGAGYYWAINRSYDLQYLATDYTSRGIAHHADLRGKPSQKSDFDLIVYGVDDHGITSNGVTSKAPGLSITGVGKADLGDGWSVHGSLDYLSSYLFRQTFSASFNEAIYSSTNSVAFLTKRFDYYTFDTVVSRNQNFLSVTEGDTVSIRKLPEFDFSGRDRQVTPDALPLWLSFDASLGLNHRVESTVQPDYYQTSQFTSRGDLEPSVTSSFHWQGFDIVPSFTMHETFYSQSLVNSTVSNALLNRTAPEVNVDFVLPPIERIFERKTFLGDKLKHVIEPRITYDYVSGVNDFLNTLRFDQTDLLADTNQVEFGLTNRLYAKKGDTVTEVLTWELYYERYFNPTFGGALVNGARNVLLPGIDLTGYTFLSGPRNYSPIVSVVRISPRNGVGIRWQADYDPLLHRLVNSMFSTDLRIKKYFVSVGSNLSNPNLAIVQPANQLTSPFGYIAPPANQLTSQAGYGDPNRKGWNAAVSTVYDFHLGYQQFAIAQVTYNTDCCGLSFEYRRFDFGAVNDTQYRVAFSIANIGTFGNLKKQERIF